MRGKTYTAPEDVVIALIPGRVVLLAVVLLAQPVAVLLLLLRDEPGHWVAAVGEPHDVGVLSVTERHLGVGRQQGLGLLQSESQWRSMIDVQ